MKTKDSEETDHVFLTMITRKIDPLKFRSTREQNLLGSVKNHAKLKVYKQTLRRVTLRLHLLHVQYDP